jgi:hypothetical protein
MRDPRVRATLSHPPADLVKLRTQGPSAHSGPQTSNTPSGAGPMALTANRV